MNLHFIGELGTTVQIQGSTYKNFLSLAVPIMLAQLIAMGSGFLCMTFLAKLGNHVLAASALIFTINLSVFVISASLLLSLSVLIGRAYGEENHLLAGVFLQHGWCFGVILSVPVLLLFWYIRPILIFFGQTESIAQIVEIFFHATLWRIPVFFISICNQQFYYAVHQQRIDFIANVLSTIILLSLSYAFIFGRFGFPAMGVEGYGYAFTIQGWFYCLYTTLYLRHATVFKSFALFRFRIHKNWRALTQLFSVGWPLCLQITGEMLALLVVSVLVGWLGLNTLAAYQVASQYQFLALIPIFSMSQTTAILVGQAFGAKQIKMIQPIANIGLSLVMLLIIFLGLIFILFPQTLSSLYFDTRDPHNQILLHLVSVIFIAMAISLFFDGLKNVLTGALRGLLDTRFSMVVGLANIWGISLPLGYTLAFFLNGGLLGMFIGFIVGMALCTVVLFYRWHIVSSRIIRQGQNNV